jgi:hypothetical protein
MLNHPGPQPPQQPAQAGPPPVLPQRAAPQVPQGPGHPPPNPFGGIGGAPLLTAPVRTEPSTTTGRTIHTPASTTP